MTVKTNWLCVVLTFLVLTGCTESGLTEPEADNNTGSTPTFDPHVVVSPFPAITNAPMIPASSVTDQVVGKELVLGAVINGEARAYPINMLTGPSREIINDTLGGQAIAATW